MRTARSTCAPERLRAPERKDLSIVTALVAFIDELAETIPEIAYDLKVD